MFVAVLVVINYLAMFLFVDIIIAAAVVASVAIPCSTTYTTTTINREGRVVRWEADQGAA